MKLRRFGFVSVVVALIAVFFCAGNLSAAEEEILEPVRVVAVKKAEFIGGNEEMIKFLSENVKYPEDVLQANEKGANIHGRVYVKFVVEKDGSISDVEVVRSVHPSLDAESVRVVKLMSGKWTPATERGKPVRSMFTLPFVFKPLKMSDMVSE
ncbi:MAG: energy transducer TonB [Paludibacteraceae bacterium]|nr:energy transducer TonB [Paludibacteraceae bacterium]